MNKRTGDKIAIPGSYQHDAYYKGPRMQRFWHFIRLQESGKELHIVSSDTLLDIGCGSGLLASFIASGNDIPVLGIDANPSAIDFCRSTYQLTNLSFQQKTTDDIDLAEGSYSKILLLEVIEHIGTEQGFQLLGKIQRLLKPGGRLVLSTPNKRSLWPVIEFFMDKLNLAPKMGKEQHEVLYTRKRLRELASRAGLRCVSEKTILFLSPWAAAVSWRMGLAVHKLEMKLNSRLGSLLLLSFQK